MLSRDPASITVFISVIITPYTFPPQGYLSTHSVKEKNNFYVYFFVSSLRTLGRPIDYFRPQSGSSNATNKNWKCFFLEGHITAGMRDGFLVVLSESPKSWTIPWGFRHLLWLRTTSARQTLRASWSGPAPSSAADGQESWTPHRLRLRSRAQNSLPVVSPFKKN